jgi:hypothetical protein
MVNDHRKVMLGDKALEMGFWLVLAKRGKGSLIDLQGAEHDPRRRNVPCLTVEEIIGQPSVSLAVQPFKENQLGHTLANEEKP